MKTTLISIIILFNILFIYAQDLTVDETVDYINKTSKDNSKNGYYIVELSNDGYLKITLKSKHNKSYMHYYKMHFSEINIYDVSASYDGKIYIGFRCKGTGSKYVPSCITTENKSCSYFYLYNKEKYINEKIYNAFSYLFLLIKNNGKYDRKDNDPFAPQNFNKN